MAGEAAVAAAVNSALVYFTLADVTLLFSMVAFLWVTKTVRGEGGGGQGL